VAAPGVAPVTQRDWEVRNGLDAGNAGAGTGAVSRYYAVAADFGDAGLVDSRAADLRFDPMPAWRRVAQPVLAVWGTNDEVVPVRNSAEALRSALVDGGANRDRTFRTFPGATHLLGVASESNRPGSAPGFLELSASWLRQRLGPEGPPAPVVSTPLPPADGEPPTLEVQRASLLERWPVQLAWLLLPALALVALSVRGRRRRAAPTASWWWLAAVAALDVAALGALAVAVVSIVDADGRGVDAVAGVPTVLLVAWLFTLAGLVATGLLARRLRRSRGPGVGVVLASSAWLLLALYWLV
jgi:hypothetical protein